MKRKCNVMIFSMYLNDDKCVALYETAVVIGYELSARKRAACGEER